MESFFKSIALALATFLLPVRPLLLVIGFAILVDTIFGIIASKKCNEPILSNKLARVSTKSVIYMTLTLLTYGIDIVLLNALLMNYLKIQLLFAKLVGVGIVIVEVFSIDEKIRKMNDNKGIWYYFTLILSKGKAFTGALKDVKKDVDELKK